MAVFTRTCKKTLTAGKSGSPLGPGKTPATLATKPSLVETARREDRLPLFFDCRKPIKPRPDLETAFELFRKFRLEAAYQFHESFRPQRGLTPKELRRRRIRDNWCEQTL